MLDGIRLQQAQNGWIIYLNKRAKQGEPCGNEVHVAESEAKALEIVASMMKGDAD